MTKLVTKSFTVGGVTFSEVPGDEGGMTIILPGQAHVELTAEQVQALRRDVLYQLDTDPKKAEEVKPVEVQPVIVEPI